MALTPIRRVCAAALTLTLVVAGCGDDDEEANDTTQVDEETTTTEAAADSAAIEVTAVDYGYEGVPATAAAGTTLTLTNDSDAEIHELVAFRLPDDEERPAAELMQLSEDELNGVVGGPPVMVLVAPPGGPQIAAVGDGTLGTAGRYLFFCAIPTGADPDEYMAAAAASQGGPPDVAGGPPHFAQGMFGEVSVE